MCYVPILRMSFSWCVGYRLLQFFYYVDYVLVGLEFLFEILESTRLKNQGDGSITLCMLANKDISFSHVNVAPPSPTFKVCFAV